MGLFIIFHPANFIEQLLCAGSRVSRELGNRLASALREQKAGGEASVSEITAVGKLCRSSTGGP